MMRNTQTILRQKTREEQLSFMSDMALELAQMAEGAGEPTLAHLFRMAALEASTADAVMADPDDFVRQARSR